MNFPTGFRLKMKNLLADEFESFEAGYERPRRRGLRVNEYKISAEEFAEQSPFPLEPIPWIKNGFFYPDDVRPARHPYYAAGLYYLQEPSAMTPASRLPLEAGDRVLDLCAAPGGKATELAERLAVLDRLSDSRSESHTGRQSDSGSHLRSGCRGSLVTNDISQQRAKALLHNLEMTGTDNYYVLNETPERLAQAFPAYFDKILVDAPCSGEGMFRKEEEALRLWSPERVADFASQQKTILAEAYKMLRPGGMLLYSTCTFAPEENEEQIAGFLSEHSDMELQEIAPYEGFSEGRPEWTAGRQEDLKKCVRIWPHRMDGEGHFLALLRKKESEKGIAETEENRRESNVTENRTGKRKKKGKRGGVETNRPKKEQRQLLRDFLCDIVGDAAAAEEICSRAENRQDKAFLPGQVSAELNGLHVMRGGQYLGDWKKNRFEPAQAWAMTWQSAPGRLTCRKLSLDQGDPRLNQYLRGESFAAADAEEGWTLICAGEYPVGWVKVVHGTVKNHYPSSWRIPL